MKYLKSSLQKITTQLVIVAVLKIKILFVPVNSLLRCQSGWSSYLLQRPQGYKSYELYFSGFTGNSFIIKVLRQYSCFTVSLAYLGSTNYLYPVLYCHQEIM